MKYILSFSLIISALLLNAQNFWNDANEAAMITPRSAVQAHVPEMHRSLVLEFEEMVNYLNTAPNENEENNGILFDLPMPDGSMETFEVFSSSIMEAPLGEKYPSIKSFRAVSVEHPTWNARFDHSPWGFNASIRTSKGDIYIQPMHNETQYNHYSYYVKDYSDEDIDMSAFICGTADADISRVHESEAINLRDKCDPWPLREFRLALACTGEWGGSTALGGGTKEKALAKMNSSINRVNQIYENEVGIRLILIANNDAIIFLKPNGDPYHSADQGGVLLSQNTGVLNTNIFPSRYDIGHIYTARCTDVGGIASLASVCQPGKGAGVTCWYSSSVDYVSVNIVCHEMGHQFSAPHTFNNCNGNESGATAFEPGGGSTIMSYSGLCGTQSFVRQTEPYFHTNSIFNITTFTRIVGANECANTVDKGNTRPEVHIPYEDGFYIPILTPFELEGSGSDCEDDPLTYSWEQYNLGRSINIGNPVPADGNVPLFRSFPAVKTGKRIFPSLTHIINNNNNSPIVDKSEVLPYYDRNMKFVLNVRDNHPGAGASNWDFMEFEVTSKAGPFVALNPKRNETIEGGTYYLIEWKVANTDKAPVNCREVDIYMYKNRDYDNPVLLASRTGNDGSEYILIPNENISQARIKIKASDNIFFDVSNYDFEVVQTEKPSISVGVFPNYQFVCLPDHLDVEIKSIAPEGNTEVINILGIENVPDDVVVTLSSNSFDAGDQALLNVDLSNYHQNDMFAINIKYQIGNGDTLMLSPVRIETIKNDYYEMGLIGPKDLKGGTQGPTFEWQADEDANTYTIEVATNPSFSEQSIIHRKSDLTKTNVRLPLLDVNSIYFWRVRGENICGPGPWTDAFVNSTTAHLCSSEAILDKNLIISATKQNKYKVNFPNSLVISDLNISNIEINVNDVEDLTLKLTSPSGKEALLWNRECYTSGILNIGFDDEAERTVVCPPEDKNVYQLSNDSLSKFIGEDAQGDWFLEAELRQFTKAGRLLDWTVEVCGNISITPPVLTINEVLETPPNKMNTIGLDKLHSDDVNSDNNRLVYTLLSIPKFGKLLHYGTELKVGDQFLQSAIADWSIQYAQSGEHQGEDSFKFIVSDDEGGWTGTHEYKILIDESYVVKTNDLAQKMDMISITPNPASDKLTIHPINLKHDYYTFSIYSTTGALIYQSDTNIDDKGVIIDVSQLETGLYYINVSNDELSTTNKVVIQ